MVWIHGGAWVLGSGSMIGIQDPSYIVQHRDVVVVVINYRLGPLGFLANTKSKVGNFGLLDQIQALRWVQQNIKGFGGDGKQVTIWGESAGAMSIGMLITSPAAEGLFHKAIMQSNVLGMSYRTIEEATEIGNVLAKRIGCVDVDDLDCLRRIDGLRVTRYHLPVGLFNSKRPLGDALVWAPMIDNQTVFGQPRDLLPQKARHIPILIGFNRDETAFAQSLLDIVFGKLMGRPEPAVTKSLYAALVRKVFQNDSTRILAAYPPDPSGNSSKNIDQIIDMTTDYLARCPTIAMARKRASVGSAPIYLYSFEFVAQFPPSWFFNRCLTRHVCHCMELPYVFHSLQHWPVLRKFSAEEHKISHSMIAYWTEFASWPSPAGKESTKEDHPDFPEGRPVWKPVNSGDVYPWMRFGLPEAARINLGNSRSKLCDLWESIDYRY